MLLDKMAQLIDSTEIDPLEKERLVDELADYVEKVDL
jgi:hypothetical protein